MRPPQRLLWCTLLCLMGCQNAQNKAAKERVFAPPPPDPVLARAKVPVYVAKVISDPATRLATLGMLFPEVAARLGSGRFESHEEMDLARSVGSMAVKEEGYIGFTVNGDMDVLLRTGGSEAMQLTYANEVLYLRNRNGAWRVSRDPADERHQWADDTYAALRTTTEQFNHVMALKVRGHETVDGRKGTVLEVSMAGPRRAVGVLTNANDGGVSTTVRLPDGGSLFHAAQDRKAALEQSEPQSLSGTVVLDDATGVPIKVDLEAVMKLPGRRTVDVGTMTIRLHTSITKVGKMGEIKGPAEAVEEIVRRRTALNPLEFWDGGAAAAANVKHGSDKADKPGTSEEEEE